MGPLSGTLAATVTPLRDGGDAVDDAAIAPLIDFLTAGRVDGILALGTTGEGIMLSPDERRAVLARCIEASAGRLRVAAHCGAQTTAATAGLAAHAAEAGADAVAVIAPPYYPFDDAALLDHFREAARACAPLPFYVYEFADRSGYAVPTPVLGRLREVADNFVGMKVSDAPFARFEPYLLDGVDVLVGPEGLILQGLERGAVGAVSGLAAAFPGVVSRLVATRDPELAERVGAIRAAINELPVPGAMKAALRLQGVPVREDVRRPLRAVSDAERERVAAIVAEVAEVVAGQATR
jgi:dihydrodipicolinate synthase/N-acetylneuraminate lyase